MPQHKAIMDTQDNRTRALLNRWGLWLLLAAPGIGWCVGWMQNGTRAYAEEAVNPTGVLSAILIILALAATPLRQWVKTGYGAIWLTRNRRYLGVAGFAYALLHVFFYWQETVRIDVILKEFAQFDMWTGWLSLLLFVPVALTSNNLSVRLLRRKWKPVQRWTYAASIIGFIHILSLNRWANPWEALIIAAPLLLLEAWRIRRNVTGG